MKTDLSTLHGLYVWVSARYIRVKSGKYRSWKRQTITPPIKAIVSGATVGRRRLWNRWKNNGKWRVTTSVEALFVSHDPGLREIPVPLDGVKQCGRKPKKAKADGDQQGELFEGDE